jgi:hypothetical protein
VAICSYYSIKRQTSIQIHRGGGSKGDEGDQFWTSQSSVCFLQINCFFFYG